ncbi:CBS domain-containing protein [Hanamia caeni]|jgi:H+/Cl- antiporter ClcA|uniref:CBS domain-containing protein n=1 Tax=Hanamia caeni TaxID=2294116 RepID=A0A3M9N4P0_9BACT|nr:chloride channel protein [Hanamia caeni]RNI32760.1 CBS domain-containing protein [Hanamia caeni]
MNKKGDSEKRAEKQFNHHTPSSSVARKLSDFTTTPSVIKLIPLSVIIGIFGAFIALILLDLIALITNILYYQTFDFTLVSPRNNTIGWWAVLIPMAGGLIVGFMARYGSERIRGHGIPEAMETILVGGSKVEPKLTILKPIASAISIGTGGPFGAEGPIILTGGAVGSVLAQFLSLTAIERRSLLVAGAVAGMSAVFGTPIAAVILGVELLLFEWKPRSFIPVAIASIVADAVRHLFVQQGWMRAEPLFPVGNMMDLPTSGLLDALVLGVACGLMAWLLTKAVYGAEDAFRTLPIHWMWWPLIGGFIVGIGGIIEPHALGVGYDTIADELGGNLAVTTLISIFVVKLIIWAVALGSGTSGGILAPILIMGAALGGLLGVIFPGKIPSEWALLGMAGALAGVMRSPFTSIVFPIELTHSTNLFLPLLITVTLAHLISVLTLKRSILTEKVARRGFHVLREYAVEPLKVLFAEDVMSTEVLTIPSGTPLQNAGEMIKTQNHLRKQRLLPIVNAEGILLGVISWQDVLQKALSGDLSGKVDDYMIKEVITTFPEESLRSIADRMAENHVGVLPVVDRYKKGKLRGLITQYELLTARDRLLQEERKRERILRMWPVNWYGLHTEHSHPPNAPGDPQRDNPPVNE